MSITSKILRYENIIINLSKKLFVNCLSVLKLLSKNQHRKGPKCKCSVGPGNETTLGLLINEVCVQYDWAGLKSGWEIGLRHRACLISRKIFFKKYLLIFSYLVGQFFRKINFLKMRKLTSTIEIGKTSPLRVKSHFKFILCFVSKSRPSHLDHLTPTTPNPHSSSHSKSRLTTSENLAK